MFKLRMLHVLRNLVPFAVRVECRRVWRSISFAIRFPKPCKIRVAALAEFPERVVEHSSKLIRRVPPNWMEFQLNKIRNLEIACSRLDRLLIPPGGIFSFCAVVGRTTRRCGYLRGLEMRRG